jgi:hypothetical protein
MQIPMDQYMTTAHAENHWTDNAPGDWLNKSHGVSRWYAFAEVGGPAPYVGTVGTLASARAVLDLMVMGFIEREVQFKGTSTLTHTPLP